MDTHDPTLLWISTRKIRRPGDDEWPFAVRFPQMEEARSIDSWINPCVDDCGNYCVTELEDLAGPLTLLPKPPSNREYYLVFTDAVARPLPPDSRLGAASHALSDETWTSSVMNCQNWQGRLAPLAARAGHNGLLSLEDAKTAQQLLPEEWPGDPHSRVTIWALYEYLPEV